MGGRFPIVGGGWLGSSPTQARGGLNGRPALAETAEQYCYSSARAGTAPDAAPQRLKPSDSAA